MNELISALEKTIGFLENSNDSPWSNNTVLESKNVLEKEVRHLKENQSFSLFGKSKIKFLFLPVGALQEISIDNGWGEEYLQISVIVDKYIN